MATQQKAKKEHGARNSSRRSGRAWKQGKTPEERELVAQRKRDLKALARLESGVRRLIMKQERIDAACIQRSHNPDAAQKDMLLRRHRLWNELHPS